MVWIKWIWAKYGTSVLEDEYRLKNSFKQNTTKSNPVIHLRIIYNELFPRSKDGLTSRYLVISFTKLKV